jgi:hypothetical protein
MGGGERNIQLLLAVEGDPEVGQECHSQQDQWNGEPKS